jgi:hypothetical protein
MVIPTIYSLIDDLSIFVRRIASEVLRGTSPPVPVPIPVPDGDVDSISTQRKKP